MGFINNMQGIALGRLIQTLPNLHQFSKNIDYCTIPGLLMNAPRGNGRESFVVLLS